MIQTCRTSFLGPPLLTCLPTQRDNTSVHWTALSFIQNRTREYLNLVRGIATCSLGLWIRIYRHSSRQTAKGWDRKPKRGRWRNPILDLLDLLLGIPLPRRQRLIERKFLGLNCNIEGPTIRQRPPKATESGRRREQGVAIFMAPADD